LYLSASDGYDVTGGMTHKIEQLMELAHLGFESYVINALKPGNLRRVLMGEKIGTVIRA